MAHELSKDVVNQILTDKDTLKLAVDFLTQVANEPGT